MLNPHNSTPPATIPSQAMLTGCLQKAGIAGALCVMVMAFGHC